MSWIVGVRQVHGQHRFIFQTQDGQSRDVGVESLDESGIPDIPSNKRKVIVGDISCWKLTDGQEYLKACGIELAGEATNRHTVFCHTCPDGTTFHVPALVLMRAFCKPHKLVLRAVFMPCGIDLLGFVDYASVPPEFVQHFQPEKYINRHDLRSRYELLRWLHSSRSARHFAASIFQHACSGRLSMELPDGQFRLALHGWQYGSSFFVNKVTAVSALVPTEDCLDEACCEFFFHSKADSERTITASSNDYAVPLQPTGEVAVTDYEWTAIEPMLESRRRSPCVHSQRLLLDSILLKLSSGCSWREASQGYFPITNLTSKFRCWTLDGRFEKVLDTLTRLRTRP